MLSPGEWGGVLCPEDTARLADLMRLLRARGEAGGMERLGERAWRASEGGVSGPGEVRGEWPLEMETPDR